MSKFKVGDRVRSTGWAKPTVGTIIQVNTNDYIVSVENPKNPKHSTFQQNGANYFYQNDNEIELFNQPQTIVIYSNGSTTTALLKEGKKVIKTALSKCSPDDTYDFETGAKIAFDRLIGEDKAVREVRREAIKGEWVKMTKDDCMNHNKRGNIVQSLGDGMLKDPLGIYTAGISAIPGKEYYVVLEGYQPPKPEVREVKRPAKVGEWIKIVTAHGSENKYKKGDVFAVVDRGEFENDVRASYDGIGNTSRYGYNYIDGDEYVVLENYIAE